MEIPYSIEINAPPERVWLFITEPERQMRWMKGIVRNIPLSGPAHAVGSKSRMTVREGAQEVDYEITITDVDRPRYIAVDMLGGPFKKSPMHIEYRLQRLSGGTQLDYLASFQARGLMGLLAWLFQGLTKNLMRSFMTKLKELAEAPDPTPAPNA